ncbi:MULTISPECIES: helix-turn-helix transcriptional regulator [Thermogemmatispora]|jgi:DNA-binding Xre family transcriptional regulator|uniref:helix-turn-helix domain-containing protein n=1 Tax=Thermogemmatispora TaxID=768669 RepID=UPI000A03A2B6|nr:MULTISPECIES: helix-turn-helix transcriptional regulator [Thermogemmatispora]
MIRLRLREIAEQKNISMSQLAKLADVDYRTVRKIFRDPSAIIDSDTLDKLCWALEVTPAELIYYEPTPPLIWQKRMGLAGEEQARHEIEEEEQERDRKPQ